ncbi:molybdopterin-dependent oxidoreductase [Chlorobium phaeobacteroides]|uniref:Oxidoreductase molybdopterin-binding domain-containing protein n=1 Tax=Chlorobium phaeobacteroides (strain DSM 266 / SMG 266 / 2430) TaxID=290317 RepID=A1BDN1_CHLPD|nr:molybdopterin-dependent oxidoreductase [Chlorobium phaeobacteroides]ABL64508.1 conserved hypothetical protein [Chlorobium phaeobacteroides DSM 266]
MKNSTKGGKTLSRLLFVLSFFSAVAQAKPSGTLSETVRVSGLVEKPFTISTTSVGTMNVAERENTAIICDSGQTRKSLKSFRGVLLRDILDSAKVVLSNPGQRGEYYVLVRSTDNYNVLFSYNELTYGTAGESTWLVFEENGKPIDDDGRFVVFCASDRATGPRHVKWVNGIEVSKIILPVSN